VVVRRDRSVHYQRVDVVDTVQALEAWRSKVAGTLGFVPTMGALHEGHLSLVRRAAAECEQVAVSIFINPTQFGPGEDLDRYPRNLSRDLALLEAESAALVFTPTAALVYPVGFSTWVSVEGLSERWEGVSRPGHFRGVATVVLKLLDLVRPQRAYFGEKDYQQLRVVERMVRDLNVPTTIVPCPTVREPDGLAMSSRNVNLAPDARHAAAVLWRALRLAHAACAKGERDANALSMIVEKTVAGQPQARLDYVAVADPLTLEPLIVVDDRGAVCCLAAWVGGVRLIDNLVLRAPAETPPRS
jgi:pantoate--beta-alanine ligase